MSENLSKKIINQIETKHIKPKPRWEFVLKNYFLWIVATITVLLGSAAFAVIIYMVGNNDWDLYEEIGGSLFGFIFVSLPYIWIVALVGVIWLAYYNFKHTDGGYKYRFAAIVGVAVLISLLLGAFFYSTGLGQAMDRILSDKIPVYRHFSPQFQMWQRPDKGLISGEIIEIKDGDEFILEGWKNSEWHVIYIGPELPHNLGIGLQIKMLGREIGPGVFEAKLIRPWFPGDFDEMPMVPPRFMK